VDLATIRSILRQELSLTDALRLRLGAIETHIVSLQQVAAAIRGALQSDTGEDDLRRLHAVMRLSNEERKAVIERFYAQVSEGIPVDEEWQRRMIETSAPRMPDNPTREQLDAWIELSKIVTDHQSFVENMRRLASESWTSHFDAEASKRAGNEAVDGAREEKRLLRGPPP
jgi:hypothetical protein